MKNWNYKQFNIQNYDKLESTNKLSFELAKSNSINHNNVISCNLQTSGCGRYGREWISPLGNLYFSLLLKSDQNVKFSPLLSFIGVVAMGEAIQEIAKAKTINIDLSYKWPNDILINNKKVSGLLLESDCLQNEINFVVIGMGVNLISNPPNTNFPATNIQKALNKKITPKALLKAFLNHFSELYDNWLNFGFKKIRNLWLEKAYNLGKEIQVNLSNQKLKGIFQDLDEKGNLVLELENKEIKLISSGEVFDS